ncbi:hypothetical protein ACQ4PT_038494 [Festuca glaucescens]
MALQRILWLLLSLIVAVKPVPCTCEERASMAGSLIHCYPAPALTNATNGTAFRASLLPLLGALPSAAAPTGFASLRSDHVFVRGLCFGGDATVLSFDCLACLSAAAVNITAGCGSTSRRAGIWNSGCFLAYADTDTSSPSEDASRELLLLSASGSGNHADTDTSSPRKDVSRKLLLLLSASGSGDHADTAFYYTNLHHMLVVVAQAVAQRAAADAGHRGREHRDVGVERQKLRLPRAEQGAGGGAVREGCRGGGLRPVPAGLGARRGLGPRRRPGRPRGRGGGRQLLPTLRGLHFRGVSN